MLGGLGTTVLLSLLTVPRQELTKVPSCNEHLYLAVYKPALTLCSWEDDTDRAQRKNRPARLTLANLDNLPTFDDETPRLHLVGRLDRDSEGLLLLTTDGAFTSKVLSPDCAKTYWALVQGEPTEEAIVDMRKGGLNIRGATTRPPLSVERLPVEDSLEDNQAENGTYLGFTPEDLPDPVPTMRRTGTWLEIRLNEGKNRQVRKITASAGHPTIRLCRISIGEINLDPSWVPGQCHMISKSDVLQT